MRGEGEDRHGAHPQSGSLTMLSGGRRLEVRFDYIIVGGGTAGCVLANRLTEDRGTRVLLLEAGGSDDYHWVHIPVGYLYCIGNPRTDWMMKTASEAGLNGRSLAYPRGKVLGGVGSFWSCPVFVAHQLSALC